MRPPQDLRYLLFGGTFVLANKLQYVSNRLVEGLSTKQWFLLRNLVDMPAEPPPTVTRLAAAMDSTRQNVAQMLEGLAREGLVRLEQDPADRRGRIVRITEAGLARGRETAENAQGFLDRLFAGIDPEECAAAGRVLLAMMGNLEKMQEAL